MIRGITEVGVAVRDLPQATRLLVERLGAVAGAVQHFEPYGMAFCMCRVGGVDGIDFELMAPTTEDGVIAEFLKRRGEGLHHIGFAVDDVAATQAKLGGRGLQFVQSVPKRHRIVIDDSRGVAFDEEVAFTFSRPDSLLGMLLEFIQYPPGFSVRGEAAATIPAQAPQGEAS